MDLDPGATLAELSESGEERIEFVAEWALKGKEREDNEYRLVDCSTGKVSADNFTKLLERYSPGSLRRLPEVTVSWFADPTDQQYYMALATHRRPDPPKTDAAGRQFYETNFFCLNYAEMASYRISYTSLYEGFERFQLPPEDNGIVATSGRRIPVFLTPGQRIDQWPPQAVAAAAWLLTNLNVCILGADHVPVEQRLEFIEQVASLLPYGMRSRLSASTWTMSTYRSHSIRLFFTSQPRNNPDDRVMTWAADTHLPPSQRSPGRSIHRYVKWLQAPGSIATLGGMAEPRGFDERDVMLVMAELGLTDAPGPIPREHQYHGQQPQSRPVEALLDDLGHRLRSRSLQSVSDIIGKLNEHAKRLELLVPHRQDYQRKISEHILLRANLPLTAGETQELYIALLRLAFLPIDYNSYLEVATSLGDRDGRIIHNALAEVMLGFTPEELRVQLLLRATRGKDAPAEYFLKHPQQPSKLITQLILDDQIETKHREFLQRVALAELARQARDGDHDEVHNALRSFGYLAVAFHGFYPKAREQRAVLTKVLTIAFGADPPDDAGHQILNNCAFAAITPALVVAAIEMNKTPDASQLAWDIIYKFATSELTEDSQYIVELLNKCRPAGMQDPKKNLPDAKGKGRGKGRGKGNGKGAGKVIRAIKYNFRGDNLIWTGIGILILAAFALIAYLIHAFLQVGS
ncbi:MAG TPA: hypothetical protein VFI65_01905 [Streptosporangiaceae bacterium]|nr:hypothetical protein [Streptosporangiaceae bacterium]